MLNIPASKMALAMMEAIAEFSKKNTNISISLVRVVIFQEDMVATYLEQMEKAMKPGSSILGMVTAPFRYIGDTIKGRYKKRCSCECREYIWGLIRFPCTLALKQTS